MTSAVAIFNAHTMTVKGAGTGRYGTYLLYPGMTDAALLLVLLHPVQMLDVNVLLQLLIRQKVLLAQVALRSAKFSYKILPVNGFS